MASRIGRSWALARSNASADHGRQSISAARLGRGEKWNSADASLTGSRLRGGRPTRSRVTGIVDIAGPPRVCWGGSRSRGAQAWSQETDAMSELSDVRDRHYEGVINGDLDQAASVMAPDVENRFPGAPPGSVDGIEGFK